MVKFRGIEISIISQFDIRKLPEFHLSQTLPLPDCGEYQSNDVPLSKDTASCYVPIYPGSQIWFEYSIDPPHAPTAAYFFNLLFNGKTITSFDCGPKHSYYGKMMYNLVPHGRNVATGEVKVVRQAIQFSSNAENGEPGQLEDVIEFRVHRIEHRKRVTELKDGIATVEGLGSNDKLQLVDGGLLEPGFPKRRYKYQLLDPVDVPYATLKFFCRTHEYLGRHKIMDMVGEPHPSSISPDESHQPPPSPDKELTAEGGSHGEHTSTAPSPPESAIQIVDSTPEVTETSKQLGSQIPRDKEISVASDTYLPLSDSDEELSIVTKDSIEDLPSTVPRSPRSPRSQALADDCQDHHGPNPALSSMEPPHSPRRRPKKKLTINLNGAEFDLEKKKRPLSPFTSGGMLRKFIPPSAPAVVTEFGPSIREEVEVKPSHNSSAAASQEILATRTTRAHRGGRTLMGFLSRRVATK